MDEDELEQILQTIRARIGDLHLNARILWSEVGASRELIQRDTGSLEPRSVRARHALVGALRELVRTL